MPRPSRFAPIAALFASCSVAWSAPPSIEDFARLPEIRNVTISPDGARIAYIASFRDTPDGREIALTTDLRSQSPARPLLASDPGRFDLSWCSWANDERVLCGLRAMVAEMGVTYPISRLVSVNADGSDQKLLLQNTSAAAAQFHDDILDWTPDAPDTVLIEMDDDRTGYPTVYEMNVYTGRRTVHSRGRAPIRDYTTDAKGNVRIGIGYGERRAEVEYFARLENDQEWRRLAKVKAFSESDGLLPIAIAPGVNRAYAAGEYEGREALWEMDLTDAKPPALIFSHPLVDAANPVFTSNGRLLGVYYETDRPFLYYTDDRARSLIASVNKLEPDKFNVIVDSSRDEKKFIIRSRSDIDAGTYYLLDTIAAKFIRIGAAYPQLANAPIGRMRSIAYPASDGVEIPGYLTVPPGRRAENLPLIVMPHGGPISRDSWEFDFLRAFLVSRGYAVLQMNFRGSEGYGSKWLHDAHQDWGGLTYSDITDAAKWAVKEGIADPKRMCIVGWSFGGYAALLGAVRNSDLYRCSASIAGVSDLSHLLRQTRWFSNWRFARAQIGTDGEKLKADSPLRHAESIGIPVLLVHGDRDYQVEIDHSQKMASALKRADKQHRAVFLKDANHQLWRKSDRVTLLTDLDKFLLEHLGPGAATPGPGSEPDHDAE